MNFSKKFALVSLLLIAANNAFASVAELSVEGTILPSACDLNFSGGNVVDYGRAPIGDLSPTGSTQLPQKIVRYTISCQAPRLLALSFLDARSGSVVPSHGPADAWFGLGTQSGGERIGGYILRGASDHTADGAPGSHIISADLGATWNALRGGTAVPPASWYGFSQSNSIIPAAFTNIAGRFGIDPYIAPVSTLNIDEEVSMDGLLTMSLVYI